MLISRYLSLTGISARLFGASIFVEDGLVL